MAIIIGQQHPRIYGGVETINSGKEEIKVDPAEHNEGLKDIDNVEIQKPTEAEAPAAEESADAERKPIARRTRKQTTRKSAKK